MVKIFKCQLLGFGYFIYVYNYTLYPINVYN